MTTVASILVVLVTLVSGAPMDDATVEDVIKLSKAGISDEVIISFLKLRDPLKLSANDIVELKKAEVMKMPCCRASRDFHLWLRRESAAWSMGLLLSPPTAIL